MLVLAHFHVSFICRAVDTFLLLYYIYSVFVQQ